MLVYALKFKLMRILILWFRGLFDKDKIAKCKKGVLIVNNARGAIMDTQAVADACSSGHVAGNSRTGKKSMDPQ